MRRIQKFSEDTEQFICVLCGGPLISNKICQLGLTSKAKSASGKVPLRNGDIVSSLVDPSGC